MAITLLDMQAAVTEYLKSVSTTMTTPISDVSGSINPSENWSVRISITNGDIPLVDVRHHLFIVGEGENEDHASLEVPPAFSFTAHATNDSASAVLVPGDPAKEMSLFPPENTLAAHSASVFTVHGTAKREGPFTVKYHMHADVKPEDIFSLGRTTKEILQAAEVL